MKNQLLTLKATKKLTLGLSLLLTLNLICQSAHAAPCPAPYEERNGLVVIEAENLNIPSGWQRRTAATGFTGSAYIEWINGANYSKPGVGLIETTIKITKAGKYYFKWHSKIGKGTLGSEHNDSWLKFPDASNFYAVGSRTVYPYGSGKTPNPNGAGSEGWFKVFSSGGLNWNWSTNTSDRENCQIVAEFNSPGVYKLQISARSDGHLLDRLVMYHSSLTASQAQNLTNTETKCIGETTTNNQAPVVSNSLVDKVATVGANLTYTFASNTFTDSNGDALTYTATLANGSSLPSWLSFNAATRTFSGVPPTTGTETIRVTANDGKGGLVSDDFLLSVNSSSTTAQAVVSFSLINADTEQEIKILSAGEVLNLATLPTKNLSIRANANPVAVGSVKFVLSGALSKTQIETGSPYALFGDMGGNFNPWTPTVGSYSLTGTPFTGSGASGTAGTSLTINFTVVNQASSGSATTYRINAGGPGYTTTEGKAFSADNYASGGSIYVQSSTADVSNTTNDILYRSERYGNFSYNLPVSNGDYTVILHFAEVYNNNIGQRKFNVDIEGQRKLNEYDIFAKAAGAFKAVQESFTVNVIDGTLNISFVKGTVNNPKVSAIEVISNTNPSATTARIATSQIVRETTPVTIATYPNPAKGIVTVEGINTTCTDLSLTITNGSYTLFPKFVKSSANKLQLNLEGLSSGIYILQIKQCGNTYTQKVIIAH